jgi:hypothetical protein
MCSILDAQKLVEKLEDLKDYAREHCYKYPNPLAFRRMMHVQRAWKRLRSIERKILREAYNRNITLVIDGEQTKFRQMVDNNPRSNKHFQMYLYGQFSSLWGNALEHFIMLHEHWNQQMEDIIKDNI